MLIKDALIKASYVDQGGKGGRRFNRFALFIGKGGAWTNVGVCARAGSRADGTEF
jgi:hypothetical protein